MSFKKILLIHLLLCLSCQVLASDVVDVKISDTVGGNVPLINFSVTNKAARDIFCRKVALTEVDYYSKGEYFDTISAYISDIQVSGYNTSDFVQQKSNDWLDLARFQESYNVEYDADDIVKDCENVQTRLTNIYVIDDQRSCGGKDNVVKQYYIDFGNQKIKPVKTPVFLTLKTNSKIYKDTYSRTWIKKEGSELFLLTSNDNRNFGQKHLLELNESKYRRFLGITWIKAKTPVLFFIDKDKFILELYKFNSETKLELLSAENIPLSNGCQIFNTDKKDEDKIIKVLKYEKRQRYKRFIDGLVLYQRYYKGNNVLKLSVAYRIPHALIFTYKNNKFNRLVKFGPVVYNQAGSFKRIYEEVSFNIVDNKITLKARQSLSPRLFQQKIHKDDLKRISIGGSKEKAKNFQIKAHSNRLQYMFGPLIEEIEGFCKIRQIFSDKISPSEEVDIDALFMGRSKLRRMINKKEYDEFCKIISMGASVNKSADYFGNRALHWAVASDDNRYLIQLINCNADVNILNNKKETPLMWAIKRRFINYQQLDDEQRVAVIESSKKTVNILLKKEANKELKNENGETAYDIALKFGSPEEILNLLRVDNE